MDSDIVKETIGYKIVNQIMEHIFPDQKYTESDYIKICKGFKKRGQKWESVIAGDPYSFDRLIGVMKAYMKIRKNPKKYGLK